MKADILARSAGEMVIGDLRQEIINESSTATAGSQKIYLPNGAGDMIPRRSGNPTKASGIDPIPNLVRRSWNADANLDPRSRASNINSETDASLNKRFIGRARWNSHYLIPRDPTLYGGPKAATIGTDPVPEFIAPDWVMVTDQGPKVLNAPDQSTIGRYAYAIYDEGGLLDINVAGYPNRVTGTNPSGDPTYIDGLKRIDIGRKGGIPFADLTQVSLSKGAINDLIGWRNFATTQPQNTFTNYQFDDPASAAPNTASRYLSYVLGNTNGFMTANPAVKPATAPAVFGRTDQVFTGRQALINIRRAINSSQDALQYLTTFSREVDAPTSIPAVTSAAVRQRFPLSRLVWLTYKGPSAARAVGDADMTLLKDTYGIPAAYLQKGTVSEIQKSFGLLWNTLEERWDYTGPSGSTPLNSIADIASVSGRDPNFFELIQAGVVDGSLGVVAPSPFDTSHQQSKMLQVLTIGASLISQSTVDSYPTRIACNVGTATMEAVGAERLPYVNMLGACAVGSSRATGGASWFLVPNIWDPHRALGNASDPAALPLRPAIQLTMNGSVRFIAVSDGPPAAVAGPVAINASIQLVAGTRDGGRDRLIGSCPSCYPEAHNLESVDVNPAPAAFDAYPSSSENANTGGVAIAWRTTNIPTPAPTGSNRLVLVRAGFPGSSISTAILAADPKMNPGLILDPGFQVTMDYQTPEGKWKSYSFLQGNRATTTHLSQVQFTDKNAVYCTWTGSTAAKTIALDKDCSQVAPWTMDRLNVASTFIKSDPRSIRFNSVMDTLVNPVPPPYPAPPGAVAAVMNSIWPSGTSPQNLGSGKPNLALYAQNLENAALSYADTDGQTRLADNGPASTNPYGVGQNNVRPFIMNRPFRSVGEMGYAFRDQPFKTLDFLTAGSADANLLDLFCINENTNSPRLRAGVVNLNTHQKPVLAALVREAVQSDDSVPNYVSEPSATTVASKLADATDSTPLMNRGDLVKAMATDATLSFTKTQHEAAVRALADAGQTRTWNLMIDIIAQSGRYPPTVTDPADLRKFVVQGEKRYWLHVAIDRFTAEVIDQQLEAVYE